MVVSSQPVQVLQGSSGIALQIFFFVISPNCRSLEVKGLMYVSMWRKEIVHHNKMNFPAIGYLNSMKAIELGYQGVRITLDMGIILSQYFPQELVLSMMYGFDDILVVPREIEEASTFTRRAQLRQDILACE